MVMTTFSYIQEHSRVKLAWKEENCMSEWIKFCQKFQSVLRKAVCHTNRMEWSSRRMTLAGQMMVRKRRKKIKEDKQWLLGGQNEDWFKNLKIKSSPLQLWSEGWGVGEAWTGKRRKKLDADHCGAWRFIKASLVKGYTALQKQPGVLEAKTGKKAGGGGAVRGQRAGTRERARVLY